MTNRIGLVQMNSLADVGENLKFAKLCLEQGQKENIDLIAFPETFLYIGEKKEEMFKNAQSLDGSYVTDFREYARKYNISILLGSICEKIPDDDQRLFNTSVLIDRDGEISGIYRKIHLYDIDSPTVRYMESKNIKAGDKPVVIDHEIGKIGLTICYDIRFPGLYQHLTSLGAEIIFAPSAFYLETGKDHWFPLLKARAIENQVYIVAPAQWGRHHQKRVSYGHSTLIDPWGTVVLCAPEKAGLFSGVIDLDYQKVIRQNMPVLKHQRYECYEMR